MNAAVRTITVDRVELTRDQVANILIEVQRRKAGAISGADFVAQGFDQAADFIRIACEQAAGITDFWPAPVAVRAAPDEHRLDADQAHALEVLERLADGDRFVLEEERLGRALQHWMNEGVAGRDEEGYFLTPAGRTYCERTLG